MIKKKAELEAKLEKAKALAELEKQKTQLKAQEAILQDSLKEIMEREEKSLKLASEASEVYEKAQRFYLNEQDWMNIQQKKHLKKYNAEAECQKHKSRQIPVEFAELEKAYNQQATDTYYNL